MRLGELLIQAEVITAHQLEEALHAQVMCGARLGTSLVELGYIDLDGLSNALAHQHHIPAALASHFDRADPELQLRLSANLAERFACVPLLRVGKRAVVVATVGPLEPRALAIIADELGFEPDRVMVAVAPELRIRYALERVYKIPRPQRFLRAPGAPRALPTRVNLPGAADLPRLEEPPELPSQPRVSTGDRRRYVQTLAEIVLDDDDLVPVEVVPPKPSGKAIDDDLPAALATIESGSDREEVANLAIAALAHLEPATEAALLLSLRGAVAVSWATFRRDGREPPPIALPVDQPGLVSAALRHKGMLRAGPDELTALDRRLLSSLGMDRGDLVVAPLLTGTRVIAALVVASRGAAASGIVAAVAAAAAAGFARLIREATE